VALFTQSSFNAKGIRSLSWRGDELLDWVGGERAFAAEARSGPGAFPTAIASMPQPFGQTAALP
jgi:hypothetical protein